MNYLTALLNKTYRKQDFNCGAAMLDNYLHRQAGQDVKRQLTAVFILPNKNLEIKGFYTLSGDAYARQEIPEAILKKLPPAYARFPVTLLGRLAIDNKYKGQGLGELLLLDALKRSYDNAISSIGSMAVVVDPLDQKAKEFYLKYGFTDLPDSGRMFIPMDTIAKLVFYNAAA